MINLDKIVLIEMWRKLGAKPIYDGDFLLQKLQYIHLNHARGKSKQVEHWFRPLSEYQGGSARFYVKNKTDSFVPVHYESFGSKWQVRLSVGQCYERRTCWDKKFVHVDCADDWNDKTV